MRTSHFPPTLLLCFAARQPDPQRTALGGARTGRPDRVAARTDRRAPRYRLPHRDRQGALHRRGAKPPGAAGHCATGQRRACVGGAAVPRDLWQAVRPARPSPGTHGDARGHGRGPFALCASSSTTRASPSLVASWLCRSTRTTILPRPTARCCPTWASTPSRASTRRQPASDALDLLATRYGIDAAHVAVSTPELWICNPALLGGPGLRRDTLTWRMELRGESDTEAIRELVLVDAQSGIIALHFNQIAHAKDRRVCNSNNVPDTDNFETNDCDSDAKAVRLEGQAATGVTDVDLAYDYSGDTYDYFFNNFGRDSLDGSGARTGRWSNIARKARAAPTRTPSGWAADDLRRSLAWAIWLKCSAMMPLCASTSTSSRRTSVSVSPRGSIRQVSVSRRGPGPPSGAGL